LTKIGERQLKLTKNNLNLSKSLEWRCTSLPFQMTDPVCRLLATVLVQLRPTDVGWRLCKLGGSSAHSDDSRTNIMAVGVKPGSTMTYDCAAISAIAELLSDFAPQKYNICTHQTHALGSKSKYTKMRFRAGIHPDPLPWALLLHTAG